MCHCYYICVVPDVENFSVLPIFIWDPELERCDCETRDPYTFSRRAEAYTVPHGMRLERGEYPWGNIGDIYPYSQDLFEQLRWFAANNDPDGYALLFERETEYMHGINYNEEDE